MHDCLLCRSARSQKLFEIERVPVFANAVYADQDQARAAAAGHIALHQCLDCGFVYNKAHDFSLMQYNPHYDNQQGFSDWYRRYLEGLADLIEAQIPAGERRVVEVGCGKGDFLNLLRGRGFEVRGFDPSYEGDDPDIVRDYFTERYADFDASLIILRHTLDAVEDPLGLLHLLSKANRGRGKIYIESPDFDWAYANNAITDVLYEHTSYFNQRTIAALFEQSLTGSLFGGQYFYCIGELSSLRSQMPAGADAKRYAPGNFDAEIEKYRAVIRRHGQLIVWGAGGKGVSFVNAVDQQGRHVPFLIDIYPKKQNCYIGVSGHIILSPQEGLLRNRNLRLPVLVANPNYLDEVRQTINDPSVEVFSWEV